MAQPKLRFKSEDGTSYPDWKSGIIGDYYTFKNGLNKDKIAFGKGTPIINYTDVFKNRLLTAKIIKGRVTLSEKEIENHSAQLGDVFFTRTSETLDEVGFCGALIEDIPNCVFSGFLLRGRPIDTSLTAPDFAGYYFMTMPIRQEIISKSSITTRALTNGRSLSAVNIKMPCLEEQQKIAEFLSNIDEIIAQSEAEVKNLEQQKKAAMQKIFSQEVRFKREDGTSYSEWINNTFSETFSALNNNTFSRNMLSDNGTVRNIHYGDILVKFGEVCDIQTTDIPKVNSDIDTDKYDKLKDGDLIIADTAEDETVGKAIEIYHVGEDIVVSGLHTMACRPNIGFAPKYLGYYINSPSYHNQLIPFMQGIKVTSIGRKNIANTVIYYPTNLEEQQKIADFLSAYDDAISYAKQELGKWKELKKGLLQQMFV